MEITYRAYEAGDREKIQNMLQEMHLEFSSLAYCLEHAPKHGLVAEKAGEIVGYGCHGEPDAQGRTICGVLIWPAERRQGIGTELYEHMAESMRSLGVVTAVGDYEQNEEAEGFASSLGFEHTHTSRYMSYDGEELSEIKGDIAAYQDEDYETVQKLVSEAFYQMQCQVGFPSPEREKPSEEEREEYRKAAEDIFVCRENGEIVAMVQLDDNEIDTLAVRSDKQGQGWGRSMLSYGVNTILKRGWNKAYLWVVVGNPAIRLYHNMQWIVEGTYIFASKKL